MYDWHHAVDSLSKRVVRIATPVGTGSGFILSWQSKTGLCALATAAHVIDHAFYWEQPIRVDQIEAGKSCLLRQEHRAIFADPKRDTAVVVLEANQLDVPTDDLEFVPDGKHLKVGNEVGWLGFPSITSSPCFFSGRVSAYRQDEQAYLIDGVAINGVSGGVVFFLGDDRPIVVGVISAYMPNRTTGEVLPGLAVARDVSYFHEQATTFQSIDEARGAQSIPEPPVTQPIESGSQTTPTRGAA
jgi:hypothetical protein